MGFQWFQFGSSDLPVLSSRRRRRSLSLGILLFIHPSIMKGVQRTISVPSGNRSPLCFFGQRRALNAGRVGERVVRARGVPGHPGAAAGDWNWGARGHGVFRGAILGIGLKGSPKETTYLFGPQFNYFDTYPCE